MGYFCTQGTVSKSDEQDGQFAASEEVLDIESRPIDGVRYNTIMTRTDENGESQLVFAFEIKKYGMYLDIVCPRGFPDIPPVVLFVQPAIPDLPIVDADTGRVQGLWSNGREWVKETRIRDICAEIMTMLTEANTPVSPPKKCEDESGFRLMVTMSEFKYLCDPGAAFVKGLRLRYDCVVKYCFKKNRGSNPYLLIKAGCEDIQRFIAAALDEYLVRERIRRYPKLRQIDPEPDAAAFVSSFIRSPPVITAAVDSDLMKFDRWEDGSSRTDWRQRSSNARASKRPGVQFSQTRKLCPASYLAELQPENKSAMAKKESETNRLPGSDDPKAYSAEALRRLVEQVKETFQVIGFQQMWKYTILDSSIDQVIGKLDSARGQLDQLMNLYARNKCMVVDQRLQFNEQRDQIKKLESVREDRTCAICMERLINTVINCGHVLCEQCAGKQTYCPFCRTKVQESIKLYV